jgi:molecular chaperone DnaK (HSP70)
MKESRFIVGIDLGTTHTVVACADIADGVGGAQTALFEIEQLVAPGEVARKPLLPSFRYHPATGELAEGDLLLPWPGAALADEIGQVVVGEWARELGAKTDGRLVSSAKSWLTHPQVDRSAAILPWGAAEGVEKVSPVLASASYLSHVRQAWNHDHPQHPLEQQEVIVTVPASFDEMARSLTVAAAAMAGLPEILLLEEPQAACYHWYARNRRQARTLLHDIRLLLVCDVGGGTTDLSLIRVNVDREGELALTRVGVGDHLMLGGDNVDLALAHIAEHRIVGEGRKLNAAALSQLIQQTRRAKETLLSQQPPDSAKVTILGSGARLVGGARSCELGREEVRALALEGFFPQTDFRERPDRRRSAVVEFGLPYAADPAVSKHIAEFISHHDRACREALGDLPAERPAIPDAVLFNGGVFKSDLLSERALDVLAGWKGRTIVRLDNPSPDLAVACGAVAYGMARRGAQPKIGGGSARSYFLKLDTPGEQQQGICLLARGTEAGDEMHLGGQKFSLRLGHPVQFHLLSSTADTRFEPGDLCSLEDEALIPLPPLVAALDRVRKHETEVEVSLVTTLTEIGTLQLQCEAVDHPERRWNVEFEIRKELSREPRRGGLTDPGQLHPRFREAVDRIGEIYGHKRRDVDPRAVNRLRTELEKMLGKREAWDTSLLRALFDNLLEGAAKRRRSMAHERIWFNLGGYALRPGFGYPLDDWRIEQVWPLYRQGLQFNRENASWSDWWTFWRRSAGGLTGGQQEIIYADIAKYLDPESLGNRKLQSELKSRSYEDMVRLAASLENLPVATKTDLGNWLLRRLERPGETPASWWAVGRIASRVPFHGSAHNVIDRATVHSWLQQILRADWKKRQPAAFAAVMLARMSGDRNRDLDDAERAAIIDKLRGSNAPESWVEMVSTVKELDAADNRRMYGEALPAGLKLIGQVPAGSHPASTTGPPPPAL